MLRSRPKGGVLRSEALKGPKRADKSPKGTCSLKRVVSGVGFLEVVGEKVYGGLDVALAHHLVRGMDVAAGDRERDSGYSAVQALDARGVGAAEGQYLRLVRDILALGYPLEVLEEPGV